MESMSGVITKHPGGSLLLFEQRGIEDDTRHRFNSVFIFPDFMLTRSNMNLKYMVFLEIQEMEAGN